jgi:hypothetical protein
MVNGERSGMIARPGHSREKATLRGMDGKGIVSSWTCLSTFEARIA